MPLRVTLKAGALTVRALPDGFSSPVRVSRGSEVRELGAGDEYTFLVASPVAG